MKKTTKPEVVDTALVEELQNQSAVFEGNWKRALADYQNLVKRVEGEKRDFIKFAGANLVARLLPTLDILELAAKHSQDAGVVMAVKQFQDVLKEEGLQEINPKVGDAYDHLVHECIETVPGDKPDTIVETVTKGYKIDDHVLRPAKVKVSQKQEGTNS